jgi:hypothetical protein
MLSLLSFLSPQPLFFIHHSAFIIHRLLQPRLAQDGPLARFNLSHRTTPHDNAIFFFRTLPRHFSKEFLISFRTFSSALTAAFASSGVACSPG